MARMNQVSLIGRIVGEPQIRYPRNGIPVYRCLLRVERPGTRRTYEPDKKYDEINIIVWGEQAEAAIKHTKPGSLIAVSGWINSRRYTKKNTVDQSQREELERLVASIVKNGADVEAIVDEILDIVQLNGHETSHVAYEVTAPQIEFLADCVFDEKEERMKPLIDVVKKKVSVEELEEWLNDLGVLD